MAKRADASAAGTIVIGDLEVSRLGLGAMRITGEGAWGEPPDREGALAVLRSAVEWGVTFIDTADSYGPEVSEALVAEALHPYPDGLVVATKGGYLRPGQGRWEPDGSPAHLRRACEGSLRRLRLEQIPLYQLHCPDPKVPFAESVGALVELQRDGKIRHIGVSNVSEAQLSEARSIAAVVSVQNRFNVSDRGSEGVLEACEREGLGFLPWAPIQDAARNDTVAAAAERLGTGPHQVVLAWLLARSPRILPIPGTSSVDHLASNLEASSLRLEPDEVEAISRG